MKVYGLIFKKNGKIYNFKSDQEFFVDDLVIVESDKGVQIARVKIIYDDTEEFDISEIKSIDRKATDSDYNIYLDNLKDSDVIVKKAQKFANDMNLDMKILSANYTLNRDLLLINFIADDRIDFRDLAKKLASTYKTRIELHQMGARDKAKEVSGIGKCGQELCCSRYLNQMCSVSMNMAKNQNLALNPSKINGACGRLLCCLSFEDEVYSELNVGLPRVGQKITRDNKKWNVISVDILKRSYIIESDGERIEVSE